MKISLLVLAISMNAFAQEHKVGVNRVVAPAYPLIAIQAHIQGDVLINVSVDEKGEVVAASKESGHPVFEEAALNAVKQWKFVCMDCAMPKNFTHRLTIRFEIVETGEPNCGLRSKRSTLRSAALLVVQEVGPPCVTTLAAHP
jgi:TonB family protein